MKLNPFNQVKAWRDRLSAAEQASREGRKDQAEVLYKQAFDLANGPPALEDQEVVTTLVHMADFYSGIGNFVLAESLYRDALHRYERIFGIKNFISAMCLRSLGEVLSAQGKDTEAQSMRGKASEILSGLKFG